MFETLKKSTCPTWFPKNPDSNLIYPHEELPLTVKALLIFVLPEIFKLFKNVETPETNKLLKLVLFIKDVELNYIYDAFVEKLFKLLNIVVDVSFRFSIFKLEYVDKAFKLLVDVIFKLFKLVIILIPETVNEVQ